MSHAEAGAPLARPDVDSPYAWMRLGLSLIVGTLASVGTWSVVVALPTIQIEFGTLRAGASLPYTLTMVGFAVGSIVMGRLADRFGIITPILLGAVLLASGYGLASQASNLWLFALAHGCLIGPGAAAGFAPLIADVSHWFRKRRGFAVAVGASGSYLAGAIWPLVIQHFIATQGWRWTHVAIGVFVGLAMVALSPFFTRRPGHQSMAAAETETQTARDALGLSPGALQALLVVAGFACCVAMSMPQVHLVAYCGDLGYGVAVGAQMLSLMLGLGIVSRIGSGFLADRVGGGTMLIIGSAMQGTALLLYLLFDGKTALYAISALFGLFQGGIVPMYAVLTRQLLPPRQAGARIGLVMMATVLGMAFGGFVSGFIFDVTRSYHMAFANGLAWNLVNLSVVSFILLRPRLRKRLPGATA
ncbi:MAG: MFS transporter [Labrys sp. (in: a-proteobacteria)]